MLVPPGHDSGALMLTHNLTHNGLKIAASLIDHGCYIFIMGRALGRMYAANPPSTLLSWLYRYHSDTTATVTMQS